MVKITTVQASHTYGVLDPYMTERRDTKFVPGSLSAGENIVILPQGGYTDRGGTDDFGRVRRRLDKIALTAAMVAMPNGGSAATLVASQKTVTDEAAGNRFVIADVTLPTARSLTFLDVEDVSVSDSGGAGALIVEYLDGATWRTFGRALSAQIERNRGSRRFSVGAPGNAIGAFSRYRVCLDATKASGTVSLSGISLWSERADNSKAVVRAARDAEGTSFQLVVTDQTIDIFVAGIWQASIPSYLGSPEVRSVQMEASYDSILLFHPDLAPRKMLRLGDDREWNIARAPFTNIPNVDYGAQYTNGVNEIQEIKGYSTNTYDLTFEGEITTLISTASNEAVKAALEGLTNVGPGLIVTGDDNDTFQVEFASEKTKERNVLTMIGTNQEAEGFVSIRTLREGKPGGEPIISSARGFPAVGRFAMGRLNMFGLRSRPATQLSSVTSQPFDLSSEIKTAVSALVYDIADSEGAAIVDALFGRTLIMFSTDAVYFYGNRKLSAEETPDIVRSPSPGIEPGVPPVQTDDAILYVEKGGEVLRLLSYSEIDQNYTAGNASVLSAFLVDGVVDMAKRRSANGIDADLAVMANADGTATALTILRTQDVSGFAPWRTDGKFVSTVVDRSNDLWFLCERERPGGTDIRLERFAPIKLLDEGTEFEVVTPSATLTVAARFEGRSVWIVAEGQVIGPVTVTAGQVTLPVPVSGMVRVGTWLPATATDQPVRREQETNQREARLKRVVRAKLSVVETTSLAIACNGSAPFDMPLAANDETILDRAPLDAPFTGFCEAEGMHGFTDAATVTVTQLRPGFLTVRSVTKDVVM
ncbi:hypothetical protein [Jiella avicenniae]|uniref:Uncharacterized protein n=1 Tax=Jiella avicenniae TaxID=2907202 RepID=A0A9X1T2N0_9HYPH|nr:hypothetical protein [Jiella avicenniae]MCE7026426.1 hypothetical protein [Jiella avicenniae]